MQVYGCNLYNTVKKDAHSSFLILNLHFEKYANNIDIHIHHIWTLSIIHVVQHESLQKVTKFVSYTTTTHLKPGSEH